MARELDLPENLAEALAVPGQRCPIPATHDKLNEIHHWWHEMARNYHEPEAFRYSLGAFIQGARGVTFMLQSEKAAFGELAWYQSWVHHAETNELLRWLAATRTSIVHQGVLEPKSWMEFRCIRRGTDSDPDLDVDRYRLNPFACTHYYIEGGSRFVEATGGEDHPHDIVRFWEIEDLPGRELLAASADIVSDLRGLVEQAHREAAPAGKVLRSSPGRYPCMNDTAVHRTAKLRRRRGAYRWVNQPPGLHGKSSRG